MLAFGGLSVVPFRCKGNHYVTTAWPEDAICNISIVIAISIALAILHWLFLFSCLHFRCNQHKSTATSAGQPQLGTIGRRCHILLPGQPAHRQSRQRRGMAVRQQFWCDPRQWQISTTKGTTYKSSCWRTLRALCACAVPCQVFWVQTARRQFQDPAVSRLKVRTNWSRIPVYWALFSHSWDRITQKNATGSPSPVYVRFL